jgi:hypothetical protein
LLKSRVFAVFRFEPVLGTIKGIVKRKASLKGTPTLQEPESPILIFENFS